MINFNINSEVAFKITEYGEKILKKGDQLLNQYCNMNKTNKSENILGYYNYVISTKDNDGYCHLQLWEIMKIFGPYITSGAIFPFETNIKFRQSDLEEEIKYSRNL